MDGPILVTGANTYIGERLVPMLQAEGAKVRFAEITVSPEGDGLSWRFDPPAESLDHLCQSVRSIVHLAAPTARESFVRAARLGVMSTAQLVDSAERAGVKRFVLLSTSRVYDPEAKGITNEEAVPRPRDADAVALLGAEHLVLSAHDRWALAGAVLRVSHVVGPPARADSEAWLLPQNDLCRYAALKKRYDVRTDALGPRDFVPITDVCRAILHVLQLPLDEIDEGLFNVCSGFSMTMPELAAVVASTSVEQLKHKPETTAPVAVRKNAEFELSGERLRFTGFFPSSSVDDEIKATLEAAVKFFAPPEPTE